MMEKHPWHFTSMKKLFGPCTKRLSLCLEASRAAGGLSKSISCASCIASKRENGSVRRYNKSIIFVERQRGERIMRRKIFASLLEFSFV